MALARFPDGREVLAEGVLDGAISTAEMTSAEKHAVSHRGRAFRALSAALDAVD